MKIIGIEPEGDEIAIILTDVTLDGVPFEHRFWVSPEALNGKTDAEAVNLIDAKAREQVVLVQEGRHGTGGRPPMLSNHLRNLFNLVDQ